MTPEQRKAQAIETLPKAINVIHSDLQRARQLLHDTTALAIVAGDEAKKNKLAELYVGLNDYIDTFEIYLELQ